MAQPASPRFSPRIGNYTREDEIGARDELLGSLRDAPPQCARSSAERWMLPGRDSRFRGQAARTTNTNDRCGIGVPVAGSVAVSWPQYLTSAKLVRTPRGPADRVDGVAEVIG